jgi:hypothetical protein
MSDSSLFDLLSAGAPKLFAREPARKFSTDGGAAMTFIGYTPSEINDILATYREHMTLMITVGQQAQSAQDAARWTPGQ